VDDEVLGLEQARAAKSQAKELFGRFGIVNGVGLTRLGDRYAVKVNFATEPQPPAGGDGELPREIAGVPVVVQVVGRVHKQAG
jgi:hypothetical protein